MIITAKEKKQEISNNNNGLRFNWTTDKNYRIHTPPTLELVVDKFSVSHFKFIPEVWDCDNFGLQSHAMMQKAQYDLLRMFNKKNQYPWSYGHVLGRHNKHGIHCSNIALTTEGLRYIEPQTNVITKKYDGEIFFAFF